MMTKQELSKLYQDILQEMPARTCHDSLKDLQQKIQTVLRHGRQKRIKDETLVSELIHLVPVLKDCKQRHLYEAQVVVALPQVLAVCGRLAEMRYGAYDRLEEDKPALEELFAGGSCRLTAFEESCRLHMALEEQLIPWFEKRGKEKGLCPIT